MDPFPDGVSLEPGPGGLDRLRLEASEGEAHVFLHGGHVSQFQPKGERPVLWLSGASRFERTKARAMPDFGDDEWPRMLCVETANVGEQALTLAPGATHVMTATLGVD